MIIKKNCKDFFLISLKDWENYGQNQGIIWIYLDGIFNLTAEVVIEQLDLQKTIPRGEKKEQELLCLNT